MQNGSLINRNMWKETNSTSLTYDSFWSSHSYGRANYQSPTRLDKSYSHAKDLSDDRGALSAESVGKEKLEISGG